MDEKELKKAAQESVDKWLRKNKHMSPLSQKIALDAYKAGMKFILDFIETNKESIVDAAKNRIHERPSDD